jgi:hypothetical protein
MVKKIDQKRIVKYYQKQSEIERWLNLNNAKTSTVIAINLHIDLKLVTELINAKAIIKINEYFKWNDKIPNTHVLAETMIRKLDEYYHTRPSRMAIPETNNIVDSIPNVIIRRKPRKKIKSDGLFKRIWKAILNN